jgi:hypothetical protein
VSFALGFFYTCLVSTSADRPSFLRDTIVPLRDVVTLLPDVAIILHDVDCILPDVSDFLRLVNGGELPRGSSEEGDKPTKLALALGRRRRTLSPRRPMGVADVVSPRRPEGVAVVVSPRRPVGVAVVVSPGDL